VDVGETMGMKVKSGYKPSYSSADYDDLDVSTWVVSLGAIDFRFHDFVWLSG
jgi:hypothetical protein